MRLSSSLLLLPVLVAAQEQVPLKEQLQGWFDKAKSFIPTSQSASAPAGAETAQQAQAPPAAVAKDKPVTPVTQDNWKSLLGPVEPGTPNAAKEWLVFVTGGNKSCFGHCLKAEKAFNDSLSLFAADPTSPALGLLDCEKDNLLCSIWSTGPPALWHFDLPVKAESDQPKPQTPIHINRLNVTTVTAEDVYKVHSQKLWKEKPLYEGAFHPMDGWLAEYGLNEVVGYVLYGFSVVPSWVMMIGISFISRSMMSRRTGNAGQGAAPAQAAAQ